MYRNMVRLVAVSLVAAAVFIGALALVWLYTPTNEPQPMYHYSEQPAPVVSATSWLVFDLESGAVLSAHNETTPLPLASITKLPVAAFWLRHHDQSATTSITSVDLFTEGEAGDLQLSRSYTYRELLLATLLTSSNDASAVLLRTEPALVAQLNDEVMSMGLQDTQFADTSGLSAGNVSTAAELATLVRSVHQTVPAVFDMTRIAVFYTPDGAHGWFNNNPFYTDPRYRGGKNGFTYDAGRTVVALFAEALGESERTLGYILLGSEDLTTDMKLLREFVATAVSYH